MEGSITRIIAIKGIEDIGFRGLKQAISELAVRAQSVGAASVSGNQGTSIDSGGNRLTNTLCKLTDEEKCVWNCGLQDDRFLNHLNLCYRCQSIDLETEGNSEQGHYIILGLKYMALLGCRLCRMLFESVDAVLGSTDLQLLSTCFEEGSTAILVNTNAITLILFGTGPKIRFELFVPQAWTVNADTTIFMRELLPDPAASSTFSIAENWLKSCCETHISCSQDSSFSLPLRVIDVTQENLCLRMISASGLHYAILSHCWGGISTITTTKANLEEHCRQINFSELSKTFRDAVAVTRKLKIDYLWIDSLCIIQDSHEDWEMECMQMGKYYKNAQLVLSALDSQNSHQGFLNTRSGSASVKLSSLTDICIRPVGTPYNEVLQRAPLSQRGWTLLERLLATRILHFSRDEMFWECLTCFQRERSTKINLYPDYSQEVDYSSREDLKCALFSMSSDHFALYSGAFARWYQIITEFSRRSLTYDSDVLPAISGLAGVIEQQTGSPYIAGLWAHDVHGLAWCKDNPQRIVKHNGVLRKGRLENNCSWSWVSTRQSIRYLFKEEKRTGSINDATIMEHSDLCLAISAIAQPVQCVPSYMRAAPQIEGFHRPEKSYWFPDKDDPDLDGLIMNIFNMSGSKIGIGCFDDPENELTLHQCWAIWIGERVYEQLGQVPVVYFLLIVPVLPKTGVWKRVGMGVTREIWAIWPFKYFPTAFDEYARKDIVLI